MKYDELWTNFSNDDFCIILRCNYVLKKKVHSGIKSPKHVKKSQFCKEDSPFVQELDKLLLKIA